MVDRRTGGNSGHTVLGIR